MTTEYEYLSGIDIVDLKAASVRFALDLVNSNRDTRGTAVRSTELVSQARDIYEFLVES